MISALYVILGALLLIKLSLDVMKLRSQYHISTGDGGFYELQTAIRIHGNAIEYLPISLLLLLFMEMNGARVLLVHLGGITLIAGRAFHYYGLKCREYQWRKLGMQTTFFSLLVMIITNIYYLPWIQIVSFDL